MGTTALRQLLKSLCNNSIWNYAVLWKLRHESPMILNWEDGYFKTKPGEPVESITNDAYCKDGSDVFCPHFEPNTSSGSLEENLAGFLVADMSRIQYTLGEGVVGRVAFTRDHCWVSFNNIFTGEVQLIPECPEEWLLQFASGIKTILLVPALPHGVLQLGSLEEVAEDVNMVANVKGRFNSLHSIGKNTAPSSLKKEFQDEQSSPLISSGIDCLNAPSTTAFTSVKIKDLNHSIAVNSVEMDNSNQSTASRVLPLLNVENSFIPVGKNLLEALQYETENNIDVPSISLAEISTPSVSMNASQLEMMESKLFELSCLMEELQAHSDSNDDNVGMFGESFSGLMSSHPAGNIAGEPAGGKTANDMDNKVVSSFFRFPKDSELHKVLGPKQTNEKLWDASPMVEDTCSTPSFTCSKDPSERTEPYCFARGGDTGYLLEAVVANVYSGSDDTSNRSSSFKSSTSISGHFAASPKPQNRSKASTLVKDDSTLCRHLKSACIIGDEIADSSSSTLRSMMDAIFSTEQHDNESDGTQPRKGHKTTVTKRRVKHGDNQRPRPRDRQLIQERVKELRELVPNSAKCSIDGLLDRTVRHMLYLKSVTDHAEKLRRCVRQEHPGIKNWRYYEAKENCQNGTSCAYEFGLEFQMCPILVEDLAYPGHMLILMLCDEQCLFLEIAQVIRGLELTILKGVLETRSDKTWARFVVEASRGFHRLDILLPLMQFLQRKRNPISSKI
uniref:MYC19 n=1 Tax=Hevea brasiliensis TaxID=3981 RepID=A0A5B8TW85_HEVBR|nr:MYC19 [Hevea brasiliensis]